MVETVSQIGRFRNTAASLKALAPAEFGTPRNALRWSGNEPKCAFASLSRCISNWVIIGQRVRTARHHSCRHNHAEARLSRREVGNGSARACAEFQERERHPASGDATRHGSGGANDGAQRYRDCPHSACILFVKQMGPSSPAPAEVWWGDMGRACQNDSFDSVVDENCFVNR